MELEGSSGFFNEGFALLTGYKPLPWQWRLFDRFARNQIPSVVDLPTGLGKTAVLVIWLLAFADQVCRTGQPRLPRRLVYVVNRRTVVDQATNLAYKLRQIIFDSSQTTNNVLQQIRDSLRQATAIAIDPPLAISTLRGELADNEEWKTDPTRPAIIIGTVDMIGSKLLFSGYGDSFRDRPHHAGLIGQDSLIVHDEAHLEPSFSDLLRLIVQKQVESGEPRPIRILELSATMRDSQSRNSDLGAAGDCFRLDGEDEQTPWVFRRLHGQKRLFICRLDASKAKELLKQVVEHALRYEPDNAKVLIYVRSPEDARCIVQRLKKKLKRNGKDRVGLLTGTLRGYERDQLLQSNPVFQAFMNSEQSPQTMYLVCTSAGEVGIDLYAQHLITEATTLESLVQRLGRVNRDGRFTSDVYLLHNAAKADPHVEKTVRLLEEKLPCLPEGWRDVSLKAVVSLLKELTAEERKQVFAEKPENPSVSDISLDFLAMTSVRDEVPVPFCIADYLHGFTSDPPETYVAWRAEVELLAHVEDNMIREWFDRCRIRSAECLRDVTERVRKTLQKRYALHQQNLPLILLDDRGNVVPGVRRWEDLQSKQVRLDYHTVVLPVSAGGLSDEGCLDENEEPRDSLDVAEAVGLCKRLVLESQGGVYRYCELISYMQWRGQGSGDSEPTWIEEPNEFANDEEAIGTIANRYNLSVAFIVPLREPAEDEETESGSRYLVLLTQRGSLDPEFAQAPQPVYLEDHQQCVAQIADRMAERLGLDNRLRQALVQAAHWHDLGKNRDCWQLAAGNPDPSRALAKSHGCRLRVDQLGAYRHEFGSVLDAAHKLSSMEHQSGPYLDAELKDLVLHLIAAHHGRGRPHFSRESWDWEKYSTSENEEMAYCVIQRYGRLQLKWGRWGLAWLESLLRCADRFASSTHGTGSLRGGT